ncbi:MAG: hypothetical protein ACFFEE_06875, partial [Candidatus Thorarchaeota archaeon]
MVQATVQEKPASLKDEQHSIWFQMDLLTVGGIMLVIGTIWRIVDQFVLGLGDTWMNIMPSKLFPFLIILGVFWRYRQQEIGSVLGLSKNKMKLQLGVGIAMGLMISGLIDIGGPIAWDLKPEEHFLIGKALIS